MPAAAQETLPTNAQDSTLTRADSVRLHISPETGEIGFIFPQAMAFHYRQVVLDMLPALRSKLELLEAASSQHVLLSDNRLRQIEQLEAQRNNLQQQVNSFEVDVETLREKLDEVNQARRREIKRKNFWRSSNYLFMGATAVLGVLVIVK